MRSDRNLPLEARLLGKVKVGMEWTQLGSNGLRIIFLCWLIAHGAVISGCAVGAQTEASPAAAGESANIRGLFYKQQSSEKPSDRVGRIAVKLVDDERERDVRLDRIFHSGDKVRFKISSNRDGWLYLLNRTLNGEHRVLWPPETNGQTAENAVKAHEDYVVPPKPGVFVFDEETGTEQLYVIIRSERKPPKLAAIGARFEQPDPEHKARPSAGQGVTLGASRPQTASAPNQRFVNFAVRGFGDSSTIPTRGIVFDPGTEASDPHLYFAADCAKDRTCDVLWEFTLNHAP